MRRLAAPWWVRLWLMALVALAACTKGEAPTQANAQADEAAKAAEVAPLSATSEELSGDERGEAPSLGITGKGTTGGGAKVGAADGVGRGLGAPPAGARARPPAPSRYNQPERVAPAMPAEAAIDPNGRFATTYRPGGGHLAAFESAVARGIIPGGERELVSDIGARYWSPIEEPKNKALAVKTDLERTKLQPGGGPFHVRLSLRSSPKEPSGRPHLSVHLVLDVSGSMKGEPIVQSKSAAAALVDKLAPTDDFSLVTFSSDAEVKVRDTVVGRQRAAIKKTIEGIEPGGGTNIGEGLRLAYEQASRRSIPAGAVRVVLLLSDGRANSGVTNRSQLSRMALDAFQDGIQTSTFGLGMDYDGALMSAIASDGAGGYYYLRDAEQIRAALGTELDKRLDPVATAVEIRIRLKAGVELLNAYGSRRLNAEEAARARAIEVAADQHAEKRDHIKRDRQDDPQGGMRFLIPAFARDDNHVMLLKLRVPSGVGTRQLADVELKYKDRIAKKNVTEEMRVMVDYANSDAESAKTVRPEVARTVQGFAAGETLLEASRRVANADRAGAIALLTEREQILRQAAASLGEQGFLRDADRLARLRAHLGSSEGLGEPLVLAMLLETAGRVHLH